MKRYSDSRESPFATLAEMLAAQAEEAAKDAIVHDMVDDARRGKLHLTIGLQTPFVTVDGETAYAHLSVKSTPDTRSVETSFVLLAPGELAGDDEAAFHTWCMEFLTKTRITEFVERTHEVMWELGPKRKTAQEPPKETDDATDSPS